MSQNKLSEIKTILWNKQEVCFTANNDVNLFVGSNGCGKTTLLQCIQKIINGKDNVVYIPSIDNIAIRDKRKVNNALSQDLEYYIFDMKTGPSLMSYRMSIIDATPEQQNEMRARIEKFRSLVNRLFKGTSKTIEIKGNEFNVLSDSEVLPVSALSSGEKLLLLILLRVFLLDSKDAFVLIDEPENSLDISWQFELIDILVDMNPNAQYFITTHSPSIFGNGWGDKVIYMEDITTTSVGNE